MLSALLLVLAAQADVTRAELARAYTRFEKVYFAAKLEPETVSYTHLTLPTILRV